MGLALAQEGTRVVLIQHRDLLQRSSNRSKYRATQKPRLKSQSTDKQRPQVERVLL